MSNNKAIEMLVNQWIVKVGGEILFTCEEYLMCQFWLFSISHDMWIVPSDVCYTYFILTLFFPL